MILGSNVPTIGGIARAFDWARAWRCQAIQIYVTPSRRWEVPPLDDGIVEEFRLLRGASGVLSVVAHVPFLVNVATPDEAAWRRSVERLATELRVSSRLGVDVMVLHPGSTLGGSTRAAGLRRAAMALDVAREKSESEVPIALESMAGTGSCLGGSLEELAAMLSFAKAATSVGVCLDTAHLFAAGYDVAGPDGFALLQQAIDDTVGTDAILCVHLNDSLVPVASKRDRHAAIGKGLIGLGLFYDLLMSPIYAQVPAILEPPDRSQSPEVLAMLRELLEECVRPEDDLTDRQLRLLR